jgi:hypothetical protein
MISELIVIIIIIIIIIINYVQMGVWGDFFINKK